MDWITKLEKKIGRFATPNLMIYIIVLYGVGFIINLINPIFYWQYLSLNAEAILHGQVWRMVTFLVQPPSMSFLWIAFLLYLYYMIGSNLESAWGAFRFNLYFWSGVAFHIIAAMITYLIFKVNLPLDTAYLNLSLFFAFAALYPNVKFLLYFIIPIKGKYLAWINVAFFVFAILQAIFPGLRGNESAMFYVTNAVAAAASVLNFVFYYLSSASFRPSSPAQRARKKKFEKDMQQARANFDNRQQQTRHKCEVCGITDLDNPEMVFRYCSKCEGNHEYCSEHLYTHVHHQAGGE